MNTKQMAKLALSVLLLGSMQAANAQQTTEREVYGRPSYWRPHDKAGINVFEISKAADTIPYTGLKLRFGAGFTQQFQNLKHETKSNLALYEMGPGFNLAMANLYTDVQLADGIRLDLTTYLSTRHHNETWVKGGYIQFDKLPFKSALFDKIMQYTTIKIGHMEVNYGDQHFRRTDAGNGIYNAFGENYIADAFSTEIGGEIYVQKNGLFGMVALTNGTINSSIAKQAKDGTNDSTKNPAVYFKAGVDKTIGKARVRLSGSAYVNQKSPRNVLYAGDRGGSWYYGVLDPKGADLKAAFTSGRFSPDFSRNVRAVMLNGFFKYAGFEAFGTYENAKGNKAVAADAAKGIIADLNKRTMNQTAIEGIYRFGAKENVFAGIRYNTVNAELPGYTNKVNIDRTSFAAGWFLTNNVLLKGEYVVQNYKNFKATDIRNGGKFSGYVVEAVVGF